MTKRIDPGFAILAWWPVVWHGSAVAVAWFLPASIRWWVLSAWLLMLPPLLCHVVAVLWPVCGTFPAGSAAARRWWWQQQMQMPFNRLPWIEELLRLIPGCYPLWIRLWGGRVALASIFAPHVVVTDRHLVAVGHGTILGEGCLLGSHLVTTSDGWHVTIAPIKIGAGVLIGARSAIGPGVVIADDEVVPVLQLLPSYSTWRGGRRHKAETYD